MILGCLRTKLAVVAEDERDAGRRQVLNLGHTVGPRDRGGHRLPRATATARPWASACWRALRLSGRDALRDEVAELLAAQRAAAGLRGRRASTRSLALVERDKKREGGRVPFVLVEAPGEVTPGHEVAPGATCAPPSRRCAPDEEPRSTCCTA